MRLLGDLMYSMLPTSTVSNPDEGVWTETQNWERVFQGSAGQDGNYLRWLCNRGWYVLDLLPELCLRSRIRAVIVEGMQPLTTEAPSWNTPYELAALAYMWSEAHCPSGLRHCNEEKLTVTFPRDLAVNICWSMFWYYVLPLNVSFTSEMLHCWSFTIARKTMTLHHFNNIKPSAIVLCSCIKDF